jgi:hypothetical protein
VPDAADKVAHGTLEEAIQESVPEPVLAMDIVCAAGVVPPGA